MGDNAESVCKQVDAFYELVKQDPDLHAPPVCRFSWAEPPLDHSETKIGAVSHAPFWFTCVVESVDRKFTLFSPKGLPLRARVTVKLREYQTVEQMVDRLQSADHTKARSLRRRERLDQLAAQEYGNSSEWRRIADKNDIDDPRRIEPGTLLQLPPMRIGSVIGGSG
jgi:nucleoid-associated protein YgaU